MLKRTIFYAFIFLCASVSLIHAQNMAITPEPCDSDRFREQAARMEQGDVDLLWVGDSITHFWEGTGKEVFDEYYGDRKTMNFAIAGDRTGHVIWRMQHSPMDKINPKMAVVMIGSNNIGHRSSNPACASTPVQTVEGIKMIVDMLKNQYPAMNILLMEVFPRSEKADDPLRIGVNEINAGLEKIYADGKVENVKLYSINDLLLNEDGTLSKEIMPDFLHPSAAGYKIWASAIEPFVVEGLEDYPEVIKPVKYKYGMRFFEEQSQDLREHPDAKILMFGDSISHQWVIGGELRDLFWNKYYRSKGAVMLAVGGDTLPGQLWRYDHYPFEGINPKVVMVEIGANDLTAIEVSKEDVAYGNRHFVKKIRERWPNVSVIVLKMLPFQFEDNPKHDGATYQSWVDEYNKIIPLYFRDIPDVTVVDLSDLYLDPNGKIIPELMPDMVHPSVLGFELWGERLNPLIEEKLSK